MTDSWSKRSAQVSLVGRRADFPARPSHLPARLCQGCGGRAPVEINVQESSRSLAFRGGRLGERAGRLLQGGLPGRRRSTPSLRQTHPPASPAAQGPPAGCSVALRPRRPGPGAARRLEEPLEEPRGSGKGPARPGGSGRRGAGPSGGGGACVRRGGGAFSPRRLGEVGRGFQRSWQIWSFGGWMKETLS